MLDTSPRYQRIGICMLYPTMYHNTCDDDSYWPWWWQVWYGCMLFWIFSGWWRGDGVLMANWKWCRNARSIRGWMFDGRGRGSRWSGDKRNMVHVHNWVKWYRKEQRACMGKAAASKRMKIRIKWGVADENRCRESRGFKGVEWWRKHNLWHCHGNMEWKARRSREHAWWKQEEWRAWEQAWNEGSLMRIGGGWGGGEMRSQNSKVTS